MPMHTDPHWDIFCRVIDNLGDVGVCWRLAADLAARGEPVRLWLDDRSALSWMAPQGAAGVEVRDWPTEDIPAMGRVVIEAFGCELPPTVWARMAAAPIAPVWINLEYLSAEAYVERSHRLLSPQFSGPAAGLKKWFFFPGFTPRTGGLIREPQLMARREAFDAPAWRARQGIHPAPKERVVSLFCYEQAQLPAALQALAQQPTLLLVTPGLAQQQVQALRGLGALRVQALPAFPQTDYDHLLWACDLNFVRGEDSFVRAQWAGVPFVWQAYPQTDGAHVAKVDAFLEKFLSQAPAALAQDISRLWHAWNGSGPLPSAWPQAQPWRAHHETWRKQLLCQPDLTTQLLSFVSESR